MKYIKPRPTVDFPDACLLTFRRIGADHFYRSFNTVSEGQKFRDDILPMLISSAKKIRKANSIGRRTDPDKFAFHDMEVLELIDSVVAFEKATPSKKHLGRKG